MHRSFLIAGASLAGLAVILGAFGAHTLKAILLPESLNAFETAVRYQMYHGVALLLTGILYERFRIRYTKLAGYAFITGTVLFSGSLYLLIFLKSVGQTGLTGVGILTPLGGLFFIAGWVAMITAFCCGKGSLLKPL